MSSLLAIDPGVSSGCAVFRHGALERAWNGEPESAPGEGWFDRVVIECPQVYRGGLQKGDPNDLIKLAVRVGRYVERLTPHAGVVELVLPAHWKGQIKKPTHHARMRRKLSETEGALLDRTLAAVTTAKSREDVSDAVALGLWKLGRLPKSGQM